MLFDAGNSEGTFSIEEAAEQLETIDGLYISVSATGILLNVDYNSAWSAAHKTHVATDWKVPVVFLTNYFDSFYDKRAVGIELSPHNPLMLTSQQLTVISEVLRKVHATGLYVTVATPGDNIDAKISDPSTQGIQSAVDKVLQEYWSKYPLD